MLVSSSDWAPMISNLQLKPLCSLILQKTINDPDKYQNGLTKIFFRAAMLAALESLRSDRLNALVTIVQKNMRRCIPGDTKSHYQDSDMVAWHYCQEIGRTHSS
jgi:myosin-5